MVSKLAIFELICDHIVLDTYSVTLLVAFQHSRRAKKRHPEVVGS